MVLQTVRIVLPVGRIVLTNAETGLFNELCQLVKFVVLSETDIGSAGKQPMKG